MNNLSTIMNNIKERITTIPNNEPIFIYIGVGTFAGLKNNEGILEQKNYHQYPPFLQNLMNTIPDLNLFIVLIDPIQEQPPYMMGRAIPLAMVRESDGITPRGIDNNVACAAPPPTASGVACAAPPHLLRMPTASGIACRISVYTLLQRVYTDPYENYGDSINITEDLRAINKYVMEQNITFLYHDFTGRRNSRLAEFFDKEIGEHLHHVIYGMNARQDNGCYFDLTEMGSYFPCNSARGVSRNYLKLFNIFYYIVNNKIDHINKDIHEFNNFNHSQPFDVNNMINNQIEQVIATIKYDLINHMLTILRVIFRLIIGDEQREYINIDHWFNFIAKPYKEEFFKLYTDANYNDLYDKLINYFSKDIDVLSKLKKLDLSGKEILSFIVYGDKPYEWYKNIKDFF